MKTVGEDDNLSKPLAPLINSLTISVEIFVLELLSFEDVVDWSSLIDEGTEWKDKGVDVCRLKSTDDELIDNVDELVLSVESFDKNEWFST